MNPKERAKQLKLDIPALLLALRHRDTPWYAKALAGLTVAYALSPIDLIPDFIPILGYLDDVLLLPLFIAVTVRLIPAGVLNECRTQAQDLFASGKPKRWYFAAPIVLLWLLAAVWIIRLLMD